MKRVYIKMIAMLLLAIMAVSTVTATVLAEDDYENALAMIGQGGSTGGADEKVAKVIAGILTITKIIGVGVAVIMLIVLAIKYISASPGDKADIKKHATVYVAGAFILFGASGIVEIIRQFVIGNFNNESQR